MIRLRSSIFCFVAVVLAGGLMLTGCASSKGVATSSDDYGIAGDWKLTSVLRDGAELAIPYGETITFSADVPKAGSYDYDVYGFSGVNNYSGPVSIDGNFYVGGPFGVTMMAGPADLENFERLYLETLTDADVFRIAADGHGMEIAKSSGETALLFNRLKLDATHWILTAYFDVNGVRSVDQTKAVPILSFGTRMDVNGFTGTNFLLGGYDVNYATRQITFEDIGVTEPHGHGGDVAVLEQVFLNLLHKASHYVWSGNTLSLIGKDGTTLLVFTEK